MSNEGIFWRGAWMIVTCVATSSATGACKDSRDDAAAASTPATPPTISIPPDVDGLRIKPPVSDEVVLTKAGGTWKLTAPSPGDADPSKVQAVLDNLASIKVVDTVSTKPDDDQKKLYQLDADHAVHVVVSKGGATILDASFGKSSGRGEMAQIAPSSAVYALSGYSSYLSGAGDAAGFRSKGASADALAVQATVVEACKRRDLSSCTDACKGGDLGSCAIFGGLLLKSDDKGREEGLRHPTANSLQWDGRACVHQSLFLPPLALFQRRGPSRGNHGG